MKIALHKLDRQELRNIAKRYGVRADKLEEYYIDITKRNFIEDVCDIARENTDIFIKAEDVFTPQNTEWETDEDDEGHRSQHLVYCGSMEELAEEYNLTEDRLYEMLGEYEDMSRELIEEEEERRREYQSLVLGRSY